METAATAGHWIGVGAAVIFSDAGPRPICRRWAAASSGTTTTTSPRTATSARSTVWAKIWLAPADAASPAVLPARSPAFWIEYQLWGARAAGLPPGQRAAARRSTRSWCGWSLRRLARSGRLARRRALRAASGARRVGGVDHRAEERPLRLFYLAALLGVPAVLRLDRAGRRRGAAAGARWYAAALGCSWRPLLSKTVTCTLPAVLLLLVWWKRGRVRCADVRAAAADVRRSALALAPARSGSSGTRRRRRARTSACRASTACLIAGRARLVLPRQARLAGRPRPSSTRAGTIDAGGAWQWLFPLAAAGALAALVAAARTDRARAARRGAVLRRHARAGARASSTSTRCATRSSPTTSSTSRAWPSSRRSARVVAAYDRMPAAQPDDARSPRGGAPRRWPG